MSGKFVVKAGQQQFKSGEKVISPVTVLPTVPNDYSHKINYQFEYTDEQGNKIESPQFFEKEVFVIKDDTQKIITKRSLDNMKSDTTLRFYTEKEEKFTSLLFQSNEVMLDCPEDIFTNDITNTDEALEG